MMIQQLDAPDMPSSDATLGWTRINHGSLVKVSLKLRCTCIHTYMYGYIKGIRNQGHLKRKTISAPLTSSEVVDVTGANISFQNIAKNRMKVEKIEPNKNEEGIIVQKINKTRNSN